MVRCKAFILFFNSSFFKKFSLSVRTPNEFKAAGSQRKMGSISQHSEDLNPEQVGRTSERYLSAVPSTNHSITGNNFVDENS